MYQHVFAFSLGMAASTAMAEGWALTSTDTFERVSDRSTFVDIMQQGTLNRFGISLNVQPDGRITGNAFGRDVTGAWDWRDGYFCRDLSWGNTALEANCQEVKVSGQMVRFTSDQGKGPFADLRLK